ncbi:nuclear transport factor 2 family protein [Croceivirga thetidis]|uniref:Nuclear transport factor 2 family protein n=1 Tax=Croceivirga thetidis TaxID=2721623 RepID=A0ABX1GWU9_9FLAO|nr:nuclear transport factor 2 family protein [Croceivirga thetidis]NKI33192.1 nuclear transport factor 2 family protein [Croceivirga thetidis]
MKTKRLTTIFLLFSFVLLYPQDSTGHNDKIAVESAIKDYVEALYKVEPYKIERSVDTTLSKVGYWFDEKDGSYRDNLRMTYQQLYDLAGSWNIDGDRITKDSPQEITIYEVNDKTAVAKLKAEWGIDIFHLAKVNDKWKIYNIIWQSHPK